MTKHSTATTRKVPKRGSRRIGRPPGQLAEDTRKAILAAALDNFARLGFERATNAEIASAAGVTAAAMYRHFESKLDLYAAAVRHATAALLPSLRRAVADRASVRDAFRALLASMHAYDDEQMAATRFLSELPQEMQRHPQIASLMLADPGAIYTLWAELVESGVRSREISRDKAQRAVATIVATFMGVNAYKNTLGRSFGEHAIAGLIDLLDGQLFRSPNEH